MLKIYVPYLKKHRMTVKLSLHLSDSLNARLDKRCSEKSMTKSALLRRAVAMILAATEEEGAKVFIRGSTGEKEVLP